MCMQETADVLSFSHVLVDVQKAFVEVDQAAKYIKGIIKAWRMQVAPSTDALKLLLLTDRFYPDAVMNKLKLP